MNSNPASRRPPVYLCPLNNAIIRLGVASLEAEFGPKGQANDRHSCFIPFPTPFPADEFEHVRLIITNRNNPQIVGAATTALRDDVQGFLLTARSTLKADDVRNGQSAETCGVSFSWMAVLPTNEPQDQRFEVRFGLVPFREYREFENPLSFTFPDTDNLFSDAPLNNNSDETFVFLTTTVSGAANAAAACATKIGIPKITAHQTGHCDGGSRLHWLVIGPSSTTPDNVAAKQSTGDYFEASNLWIHATRGEPTKIDSRAWEHCWMKFVAPLRERAPCVFATTNRHGVEGHLAGAVVMSWHCKRESYVVKYRSFDTIAGAANFDAIAIGHCDATPDEVSAANQAGQPLIEPWERFLEAGFSAPEYVRNGQIGANEFHESGGSLLFHTIYEDDVSEFQQLLELGADINQQHPSTHARPIHIAAAYDRQEITKLLIESGADVDAPTIDGTESNYPPRWKLYNQYRPYRGETALHLAMYYRNFEVARLLLSADANPNAEDAHGDRPIDYVPWWHTYPDNQIHWRLLNERSQATRSDYEQFMDWILSEVERYKQ